MPIPTLPDVKAQLNISGSTYDDLLVKYLAAALALIEARVGPATVRTCTEQVTVRTANAFNLSYRPINSITSVTALRDGQGTVNVANLEFDARSGSVWARDYTILAGSWEVVYEAGHTTFPENYFLATLITVQHLWKTTRGGSRRPTQGGADELSIVIGSVAAKAIKGGQTITLPAAALELLGDSIYFGGIA